MTKGLRKLTKREQQQLDDLLKEMSEIAKNVVEDYDEISPHKEFKNQLMDPNLKQKLKFVFCGDVDYSMIRTWNKNCEYK